MIDLDDYLLLMRFGMFVFDCFPLLTPYNLNGIRSSVFEKMVGCQFFHNIRTKN